MRRIRTRWLRATATLGVVSACLVSAGPAAASGYALSGVFSLRALASPSLLVTSLELPGSSARSAAAPASALSPFTVTLRASRAVVGNGRVAKLAGRVAPGAAHKRVELQARAGGRWRTISSRSLSKSSGFAFTTRLSGVGGHFLRVLKPSGSGHAQGVSSIVELIVPGRRTVRSRGGALRLSLGAVRVSAPKGAIDKGKTLSISVGAPTGFGAEGASSVAGGPYLVSTSQGEPHKPVTVTIGYDPGLLAPGDKPLLLHGWTVTRRWVPEVTTVHGHSVSATLDSFSPIDVIDWGTYYAGILTGNRADLPSGCGSPPSWIDSVTLPDSNQDPLPACFSSKSSDTEAVLNVVNNRGYAQTVTVSGAKINVTKSSFASSFEGQIGKLLAQLSSGSGPSAFELGPGEGASIAIDRPPPQLAALEIHIDPAGKTAWGVGELAWALLTTAKDQIGVPVDMENCVQAAVYNTLSADRGPDTAIGQMHSCVDAASGLSGTAKAVLEKLAYGLLVDDFFYKLLDLEDSEVYPARIEFTIPGSNPTFTNPNIHVGPANYGTLPDGSTTTEHLTANGGTPPYRYYIWNDPANMAGVPSWVSLAPDGTLTIEPPASASGEVSFYVYAFDSNGEHSPFKRDQVSFQTFSGGGAGGGGSGSTLTAGGDHTCALLKAGTVDCWGANGVGELGTGTSGALSTTPVKVVGITTATVVSAGLYYTCALLAAHTVDCWGINDDGQLGTGSVTGPTSCGGFSCSPVPVQVLGITDAIALAAYGTHTCAVLAHGSIVCWGGNGAGELGDGVFGPEPCGETNGCSATPVPVVGIARATGVSAGSDHTCALILGGSLDCWGRGNDGELGAEHEASPPGSNMFTILASPIPLLVSGNNVAASVSAGGHHTCSVLAGGSLTCWGENNFGELGNGTDEGPDICTTDYCSPTPVPVGGISDATTISAGGQSTCSTLSDGKVDCWGATGESGPEMCNVASVYCSTKPVEVAGIANAVAVSVGAGYACVVLTDSHVDCWGHNQNGQLGDGTTSYKAAPVPVSGIP